MKPARRSTGSQASQTATGNHAKTSRFTATQAKNEFGRVLESAIRGDRVFITKHDDPKAVLISIGEFDALSRSTKVELDSLSEEFDALLDRMQSAKARANMKAAFKASPRQLGRAAVNAAKKRG